MDILSEYIIEIMLYFLVGIGFESVRVLKSFRSRMIFELWASKNASHSDAINGELYTIRREYEIYKSGYDRFVIALAVVFWPLALVFYVFPVVWIRQKFSVVYYPGKHYDNF